MPYSSVKGDCEKLDRWESVFNTDMLFKDYPAAFACLEACADAQLDACRMSLESSVEKKETIEQ